MGRRDTILIVDDMEMNRVILRGLFQDEYHLLEAENGEQALLLIRQCHSSLAMILLDVIMPVMNGYQVMEELGAGGFLSEAPVVVITAGNSLESELRSFDLGASDLIVRPFEPQAVKRRVHNMIELYRHRHNLEELVDQQAANMILSGECGMFSPRLLECFKTAGPVLDSLRLRYAQGQMPLGELVSGPSELTGANAGVSGLQMEQMKYLALLRYENAMVVEADFSSGVYRLAYVPDKQMKRVFQGGCLEDALKRYLAEIVMPEDREVMERVWYEAVPGFFEAGLMRKSWRHRVSDSVGWSWCELTVLRVDVEDPRRKEALLLWKGLAEAPFPVSHGGRAMSEWGKGNLEVLHNVLKGRFKCRNDRWLTITEVDPGFMGYEREEIRERFHDRYLEIIHPEDRDRVKRELSAQLDRGNDFELEYRLLDRDGEANWVLGKGCLVTDGEGQECLYSVAIDINRPRNAQEQLRLGMDQYKIIMEQTNDIFFEWDIVTDTVKYSPNWMEKFGYVPISSRISERIPGISHIHPEDMAPFGAFMGKIRSGCQYGELEFRVSDARGRYQWCKLRAATQFDGQGRASKAIGLVMDINDDKMEAQELKARAERDTLTRLYNKASSRQRIENILENREPGEGTALFIIDIDDFKQVNDKYGHMFGDAVLTKIASQLSRLFGSGDIVSRIGGDEFMALCRGIQGDGELDMTSGRILECFDRVLEELPRDCRISSSIGIAVCPRDGSDFQTLFQRADVALYHAKACGKKQYQIYDQFMECMAYGQNTVREAAASTAIDSEEGASLVLADLLPRAFNILSRAEKMDQAVEQVLELLGERLQVSRAYVFENSEDNLFYSNTFEWCARGIRPMKEELQNVSYSEIGMEHKTRFNERGVLYCDDIELLPKRIRDRLKRQGIKSILQCAIKDNGVFRGWVGFDDCTSKCLWTINQIEVLSFISELLSLFLLKQRAQNDLAELAGDLRSVLDHQNSWIFVMDVETYELLYVNEKARKLAPQARVGMRCYEAFYSREEPCCHCPMANLKKDGGRTREVYNPFLKVWCLADASTIRWGRREAGLMACHDITRYKDKPGDETDK